MGIKVEDFVQNSIMEKMYGMHMKSYTNNMDYDDKWCIKEIVFWVRSDFCQELIIERYSNSWKKEDDCDCRIIICN